MTTRPHDIAALLGSRICHDLISPIGAIGNGVELLQMSDMSSMPEVSLIADSVGSANARIRYYRIAFGGGSDVARIGSSEIQTILGDLWPTGRLAATWDVTADVTRNEAKLALLLILCMEVALPYGGDIQVSLDGNRWRVSATAEKLKIDENLWALLTAPSTSTAEVVPAQVQFLLASEMLEGRDPAPRVVLGETEAEVIY